MTGEYEEKRAAYENLAAGLESNLSKLEHVSLLFYSSLFHSCTATNHLACLLVYMYCVVNAVL